jgi:prepilin signal peptidase PulO-like enzyme (type II secretory pathway)
MLFAALLVPITFIDLETFQIPTSLNLLVFAIAIGRDIWGIALHEPAHALLWGWLPRFVPGAVAGILIFGGVRVAGWIWKRREAMGLGDVILARAMGAMLVQLVPAGLPMFRLYPAWVLLSCVSGMVVGILMILSRSKARDAAGGTGGGNPDTETDELEEEEPGTLGGQLREIGYCLWIGDLVDYVQVTFHIGAGARAADSPEPTMVEDDFVPEATAIPFGPFLAVGFLATVFVGEALTAWYLAVALPKPAG